MESISTFFKKENGLFFYEGKEEGREKLISKFIKKLGLSDEQVAGIVEVPLELVQKAQKKLQK